MLVLSRFVNQRVRIRCGEEVIDVVIVEVFRSNSLVRLGFDASPHVQIDRLEIDEAKRRDAAEGSVVK